MNYEELFWESSIIDLKKGYKYDDYNEKYICIMCNKIYERGIIYEYNNKFVDAEYAVKVHIEEKHKSTFNYLLNLDKKYNGLYGIQKKIMEYMYKNIPDSEIALKLNNKSKSTIRGHRFNLREKYKESKIFIALMDLIDEKRNFDRNNKFVHFHKNLPVNDERIIVTENEKESILNKYFDNNFNMLKRFPKKEKEKLIVLQKIINKFDKDKKYTEKEINGIIKNIFGDYVTIRRYLVDYGFLDRKIDCSEYWVKQ